MSWDFTWHCCADVLLDSLLQLPADSCKTALLAVRYHHMTSCWTSTRTIHILLTQQVLDMLLEHSAPQAQLPFAPVQMADEGGVRQGSQVSAEHQGGASKAAC